MEKSTPEASFHTITALLIKQGWSDSETLLNMKPQLLLSKYALDANKLERYVFKANAVPQNVVCNYR